MAMDDMNDFGYVILLITWILLNSKWLEENIYIQRLKKTVKDKS